VEKEFHDWLSANRYAADAKLYAASTLKPLQNAAQGYLEISRLYSEPLR
jgi:hypothetical protein